EEFVSVSSTPDSTPPCTDGGNEESDFPELLTAREWSEDEEGPEDDLSSSSLWGTPRQNSFELTFSYIAFSEGESSGRRDSGRRRTGGRGRRGSLRRMDTVETFLPPDFPAVEWDPLNFLSGEEEQRVVENQLPELVESHNRTLESSTHQFHASEPYVNMESTATMQTEEDMSHTTQSPNIYNTQEEQSMEQWLSKLYLPEGPTIHIQIEDSSVHEVNNFFKTPVMMQSQISYTYTNVAYTVTHAVNVSATAVVIVMSAKISIFLSLHVSVFTVMDLIYWKDTERTGMLFTGLVVGLLSLFQLSIITVLSTVSLAIVCFTISVRIYCKLLHALQLRDGAHPFQTYLDVDIGLSGEQAEHYMQRAIYLFFAALDTLRQLVFVANLFDSLKFLLLMYLVTYLGALCNGLTLLIIGVIAVFSVPLFYTRHQ
ncbi:reticulon 2a isoform X1, partial [Silurus asotus]